MATKSAKKKWSAAQVKEHIAKIEEAAKAFQRQRKTKHFTSVKPEDVEKKLKRVNSPMIVFQGWNDTSAGGTVDYTVGIHNPDPTQAFSVFAHVWVGSGNVDPTTGTFLLNVDARFPRLTEPAFPGLLTLTPGATVTLDYALKVPVTVEKTSYMGNSCLMQFNWHDIGQYLDRGIFVFTVS